MSKKEQAAGALKAGDAEAPDEKLPIEDVLPGMRIHPLGEGETATWAFVLMKIEGPDSEGWSFRTSSPPNKEELLGALEVQVALLKKSLVKEWTD